MRRLFAIQLIFVTRYENSPNDNTSNGTNDHDVDDAEDNSIFGESEESEETEESEDEIVSANPPGPRRIHAFDDEAFEVDDDDVEDYLGDVNDIDTRITDMEDPANYADNGSDDILSYRMTELEALASRLSSPIFGYEDDADVVFPNNRIIRDNDVSLFVHQQVDTSDSDDVLEYVLEASKNRENEVSGSQVSSNSANSDTVELSKFNGLLSEISTNFPQSEFSLVIDG
jgi:hypothetical protein